MIQQIISPLVTLLRLVDMKVVRKGDIEVE